MKSKLTTAILLMMFSSLNIFAQQKGSFNTTITFRNQSRMLSCFVPANYDSTQKYQLMICLHGSGDNSNNYRNALINSLNWPGIFANTIFICPDGGDDQVKDFYAPAGDERIIDSSIQFACGQYHIDTSKIILQGFSLGGRSSLKYGLENPTKFKGLLLNTPAIQGLSDAENNPKASLIYNYANSKLIPIYITVGDQDYIYDYTLKKVVEKLKKNDAMFQFREVAGMAHNIPVSSIISPCLAFFNQPAKNIIDADIFEIDVKERTCDAVLLPKCFIRNLGSTAIGPATWVHTSMPISTCRK